MVLVRLFDQFQFFYSGLAVEVFIVLHLPIVIAVVLDDFKKQLSFQVRGRLHAFDQHLNMVLSQVEETVTTVELDEENFEEMHKQTKRQIPMLFVRGDAIILVAPPLRHT